MHELKYKEVKIIESSNVEMNYARNVMKRRILEEEKNGWHKYGKVTCIYDEKSDTYLLVQVMIK